MHHTIDEAAIRNSDGVEELKGINFIDAMKASNCFIIIGHLDQLIEAKDKPMIMDHCAIMKVKVDQ